MDLTIAEAREILQQGYLIKAQYVDVANWLENAVIKAVKNNTYDVKSAIEHYKKLSTK